MPSLVLLKTAGLAVFISAQEWNLSALRLFLCSLRGVLCWTSKVSHAKADSIVPRCARWTVNCECGRGASSGACPARGWPALCMPSPSSPPCRASGLSGFCCASHCITQATVTPGWASRRNVHGIHITFQPLAASTSSPHPSSSSVSSGWQVSGVVAYRHRYARCRAYLVHRVAVRLLVGPH